MNIETSGKSSRFKLLKTYSAITSNTLQEELSRRKIPLDLAGRYLQQALVLDRRNQRKYMALAFRNVVDSFEIIIPFPATGTSFRSSISTSTFTFIEGRESNHAQIFSSVWDFLTWLTLNNDENPRVSTYILNGSRSATRVINHIKNEGDIVTIVDFLDNNMVGDALRLQIADSIASTQIRHASQNYLYSNHRDLNEYLVLDEDVSTLWPILDK